jgi:putative methyltransferase (TIGR04325 family)
MRMNDGARERKRVGMLSSSAIPSLDSVPLLRPLLRRIYERRFASSGIGSFRGVFHTFADANQSAPRTKPLGFNCPEYALEFRDRLTRIFSFDYPVIFWLARLMKDDTSIFDYGGHAGTHFYAYSRYLSYPRNLSWLVCDLPEITRAGEDIARQSGSHQIRFTTRFEDGAGSQILIAAGSLQYIESPALPELLSQSSIKPAHLLLNKLPLYHGEQFVTLQNGGAAFHPQYVFNRERFLAAFASLGYRLKDAWDVESHPGRIPFHPDRSFRCHSGLYLTLEGG